MYFFDIFFRIAKVDSFSGHTCLSYIINVFFKLLKFIFLGFGCIAKKKESRVWNAGSEIGIIFNLFNLI
jgi:hypothetical protein